MIEKCFGKSRFYSNYGDWEEAIFSFSTFKLGILLDTKIAFFLIPHFLSKAPIGSIGNAKTSGSDCRNV